MQLPAACHYLDVTFVAESTQSMCPSKSPRTGSRFNLWHPTEPDHAAFLDLVPEPGGRVREYESTQPGIWPLHSARDHATGGSGLGLAIVHRAVQTLGGRIELDSTPGKGPEFRVTLPADGLPSQPVADPRDE